MTQSHREMNFLGIPFSPAAPPPPQAMTFCLILCTFSAVSLLLLLGRGTGRPRGSLCVFINLPFTERSFPYRNLLSR